VPIQLRKILDSPQRSMVRTLVLAACLLILACDPKPTPTPRPSPSVVTDPHATDSLAKLKRVLLTTSDPHAVRQLMICEEMRLYSRLGVAEGRLRMKGMADTIYKTRADTIAFDLADSKLASNLFTVDSFYCASFEADFRKKHADSLAQHSK
jgi:hypothetical protein